MSNSISGKVIPQGECLASEPELKEGLTIGAPGIKQILSPSPGDVIAVWFSCGAASAVAAKLTLDRYSDLCRVRVINTPILEEHPDNRRFLADVEQWLGVKIELAINPRFPSSSIEEVFIKKSFMSGPRYAPCTELLKKHARQLWERSNFSQWLVLGFTAEEVERYERFRLTERENTLPVLIQARLTRQDCFRVLRQAGIDLPLMYSLGYPNANCIGCVKASSPTYWNLVRNTHPEVFEARASLSRDLGCRLVRVKGERIFLDQLDPLARGNRLSSYRVDCGIFCEEGDGQLELDLGLRDER